MHTDERKEWIREQFQGLCCEMEGAAIGHVCRAFEVPFVILRAISDDLDENKGVDFKKFCQIAADKTVTVLGKFLSE